MIRREKAVEFWKKEQFEAQRSMTIVRDIPIGRPVLINYWLWPLYRAHQKKKIYYKIACIVNYFNTSSIHCQLIAMDKKWYHSNNLYCKNITHWEIIDKKDLPLFIGYQTTYDLLAKLLKE